MLKVAPLSAMLMLLLCSAEPDPLVGHWVANLARSKFVDGFPLLKDQAMDCESRRIGVKCVVVRTMAKGIRTQSEFVAQYDGKEYPVVGSDEITGVILKRSSPRTIESMFVKNHHAVFSYRIQSSEQGQILTITSTDPQTRRDLTSVVVYERK